MKSVHKPVLLQEVLEMLEPKEGDVVLDGTLGGGGHASAIAQKIGPRGVFIGLDQDLDAVEMARANLSDLPPKVYTISQNFRKMDEVLERLRIKEVDKILLDVGLSSDQLEHSNRGFSFQREEPLLMTMQKNTPGGLTAREIVNHFDQETLETIIQNYGDERWAKKIARVIVEARGKKEISSTGELRRVIEDALPRYQRSKIHPATKTFQALRIAVNDEYSALGEGLLKGWNALSENGRMAIISFHSLEDRLVKQFFREKKKSGEGEVLTKKPITPTLLERQENPRSRSAKLRLIQKIGKEKKKRQ